MKKELLVCQWPNARRQNHTLKNVGLFAIDDTVRDCDSEYIQVDLGIFNSHDPPLPAIQKVADMN